MREEPLISVIIPVYQVIGELSRCAESVLSQTHKNLEIIFVDDGSTDGSSNLCDMFAQKDNRVCVIHQANAGVSAARNAGLKIAKGEFIGFVDSDDWIEPDMYERLLRAVCSEQKQIAVCGYISYHLDCFIETNIFYEIPKVVPFLKSVEYLVSPKCFEGFSCNKLFDSNLFHNGQRIWYDETLHFCEDLLAVSQCFLKADGVAYVPEALYHYCIRENSAMKTYGAKRLTELAAREKVMELLSPLSPEIKRILRLWYMDSAIELVRMAVLSGDQKNLSRLIPKSRRYWKEYYFGSISFKRKLRGTLIILFPHLSIKAWQWIKRSFYISWYGKN